MKKTLKITRNIINIVIFFIVILAVFSTIWALNNYDSVQPEEILFYLTVPIDSTESGILISYFVKGFLPALVISVVALYFIRELFGKIKGHDFKIKISIFKKSFKLRVKGIIVNIILNITMLILTIVSLYLCLNKLNLNSYLSNQHTESTFIEENFTDSKDVKLTFPKNKRNLIYIYAESLETTFLEKTSGGAQSEDLMPDLKRLAEENINFSNTNNLGGAVQVSNLSWTTAGIVGTTSGLPLKISSALTNEEEFSSLLSGAYSLGEILEKEGYNQMAMFGSDADFGNRKAYLKGHGNYQIYDYNTAIKQGKIPNDYYVWWGFEDSKLFSYAKEEITSLASKDEPFNFTMLTTNTHHPNGYVDAECEKKFTSNYANAIACTNKQISEFISWLKEQDFYDNTTVVITGDHLSMDPEFFKNLEADYERTVFNVFINSAINSENTKNRLFTTMDLFPTTLASLGVEISGNKLALGTNLFSGEKTIIEEYGKEKVNAEIPIKSSFYNQKIINNK